MSVIKTLNFIFDEKNLHHENVKKALLDDLKTTIDKKIRLAVDLSSSNETHLSLDITYINHDNMKVDAINYCKEVNTDVKLSVYYFGGISIEMGYLGSFEIFYSG
jgi:hypothetical protein